MTLWNGPVEVFADAHSIVEDELFVSDDRVSEAGVDSAVFVDFGLDVGSTRRAAGGDGCWHFSEFLYLTREIENHQLAGGRRLIFGGATPDVVGRRRPSGHCGLRGGHDCLIWTGTPVAVAVVALWVVSVTTVSTGFEVAIANADVLGVDDGDKSIISREDDDPAGLV
ncbi:hypothetical protein BN903_401 [Halorubrum sp. AJ67]|nr:hypothetical protein BN903_401 [Halorubrum sp. AJ67]